ncbi:MAG: hypothetical protein P4L41_16955 [Flavipsychrobacter sp.]|nr:hypothetical protein [Flavipsychrobacter sp.]
MKSSLGTLNLSPVKEDGKFMFCNNIITINGKISKGDRICILVDGYDIIDGKHFVKRGHPLFAKIVVRGEEQVQIHQNGNINVEDYYMQLCELYRTNFYFGKKTTI